MTKAAPERRLFFHGRRRWPGICAQPFGPFCMGWFHPRMRTTEEKPSATAMAMVATGMKKGG